MAARKKKAAVKANPGNPVVPADIRRKSLLPKAASPVMANQSVSLDLQKDAFGGMTVGIGLRGPVICSLRMPYVKAVEAVEAVKHRYQRLKGLREVPDVFKPYMPKE